MCLVPSTVAGPKKERERAVCSEYKGDKKMDWMEYIKSVLRMKTVTGHWQESTSYSWWMRERLTTP